MLSSPTRTSAVDLPHDVALEHLCYDPVQRKAWETLLPGEERASLRDIRHEGRRRHYVMGRACARLLLADRLHTAPVRVPLDVAEDGGVDVPGTGLHLSIAHSGERAAAAVAQRRVGVDIERIVHRRPDLYRYVLHPSEYEVLEQIDEDRNVAQLVCWSLKEAVLKGLRTGLRLSPKKLRLQVEPQSGTARLKVQDAAEWHARYEFAEGYVLALAYLPD